MKDSCETGHFPCQTEIQIGSAPQAINLPGMAGASAPKITPGKKCPITWREATGAATGGRSPRARVPSREAYRTAPRASGGGHVARVELSGDREEPVELARGRRGERDTRDRGGAEQCGDRREHVGVVASGALERAQDRELGARDAVGPGDRIGVEVAERRVAAANEQIGIAQAAYYPTLNLAAVAGFEGTSLLNWFNWPSRFWAVGASMSETLFDGGRRRASTESERAGYDASIANYRQTVLTSFQQVEDNLVVLRELSTESIQQHEATASAEESLRLFQNRYAGGVDTYLQVVTSQTTALANERNDIDLMRRRLEANLLLIKAIGGGWDISALPNL